MAGHPSAQQTPRSSGHHRTQNTQILGSPKLACLLGAPTTNKKKENYRTAVADKSCGERKIIKLGREIRSPRKGSCYFKRLISNLGCGLTGLLFQLGTASTRVPAWAELGHPGNSRPTDVTGAIRETRNQDSELAIPWGTALEHPCSIRCGPL